MDKCNVIAIANQKGGVGKTTTTINLGVGLSRQGKRVLLIDADPQGSLTLALGVQNPELLPQSASTVLQAVIEGRDLEYGEGIFSHAEGVELLPSNIELSGLEANLFGIKNREQILKDYVEQVREYYDYILIDCMPSLGMMTINSLVAADSVIIPSQASYLAVKGLDLLLRSIGKVRGQINPGLQIDGILLTMVDSRTNNARDIAQFLRDKVGGNIRVFETEIPHSVRAAECPVVGKSIFSHDKRGKVAAAYEKLAKEVMDIEKQTQARSRSGWIR